MEFDIEKCVMLIMRNAKRHMTEGRELPNQEKIRTLGENETYKYLGILEADTIKHAESKEKNLKMYFRRTKKLLETKLYGSNLIKGTNSCSVPLIRYSAPFLNCTRKEFLQMDQCTRKLMTYTPKMTLTDSMNQENIEEGFLSLKRALMHRY